MTPEQRVPDYGLFVDILLTLERIQAPYMVIGGDKADLVPLTMLFDAVQPSSRTLDLGYIDWQAQQLGEDVHHFWRAIVKETPHGDKF